MEQYGDFDHEDKYMNDLIPIKRSNKINNDICINQSNINFEKFFINKKYILCKKGKELISAT